MQMTYNKGSGCFKPWSYMCSWAPLHVICLHIGILWLHWCCLDEWVPCFLQAHAHYAAKIKVKASHEVFVGLFSCSHFRSGGWRIHWGRVIFSCCLYNIQDTGDLIKGHRKTWFGLSLWTLNESMDVPGEVWSADGALYHDKLFVF